jgi:hypothetical protein
LAQQERRSFLAYFFIKRLAQAQAFVILERLAQAQAYGGAKRYMFTSSTTRADQTTSTALTRRAAKQKFLTPNIQETKKWGQRSVEDAQQNQAKSVLRTKVFLTKRVL